jgi:hypothetical protein
MRFRETLWFKKGLQEETEPASDSSQLPIEDRYVDDGTVAPADTKEFGVHTGTTQAIGTFPRATDDTSVDERILIREMKWRSWLSRKPR